jgi:hypothetical protein
MKKTRRSPAAAVAHEETEEEGMFGGDVDVGSLMHGHLDAGEPGNSGFTREYTRR